MIYDGNSRICLNAKLVDEVACIHVWWSEDVDDGIIKNVAAKLVINNLKLRIYAKFGCK